MGPALRRAVLAVLLRLLLVLLLSLPSLYMAYFTTLAFLEVNNVMEHDQGLTQSGWWCGRCAKEDNLSHRCQRCVSKPKSHDLSVRNQVTYEVVQQLVNEEMHPSLARWFGPESWCHVWMLSAVEIGVRNQHLFPIAFSWLYACVTFCWWIGYLVWPSVLACLDIRDRKVLELKLECNNLFSMTLHGCC